MLGRLTAIFAVGLFIAPLYAINVHARDKDGDYTSIGDKPCGEFLDAYSRMNLSGEGTHNGPAESWGIRGFLAGYISAYNEHVPNGKSDTLGSMSFNDANRWIASWCRDNPSGRMSYGINALLKNLEKSPYAAAKQTTKSEALNKPGDVGNVSITIVNPRPFMPATVPETEPKVNVGKSASAIKPEKPEQMKITPYPNLPPLEIELDRLGKKKK